MTLHQPGIYALPADTYHADPCAVPSLSSTIARVLLDHSPLHAWTACRRLNPDHEPKNSKTFDIGRAAHRAVLGKGEAYAVCPEEFLASNGALSTKAAKEWVEDMRAAGVTPVKQDEADAVQRMADAVRKHLSAMRITLDPARSELTALGEIDGTWCRAMIDNAPADPRLPLYDLKTTTDANPEGLARTITNYGYDVQARFYLDAWRAATGESRRFRFIFVEKEPPHAVSVVELLDDPNEPADWMLTAASQCDEARRLWRECLAADHWPGYPPKVAVVGAPAWHAQKWADRSIGNPIPPKPSPETVARVAAWQAP